MGIRFMTQTPWQYECSKLPAFYRPYDCIQPPDILVSNTKRKFTNTGLVNLGPARGAFAV